MLTRTAHMTCVPGPSLLQPTHGLTDAELLHALHPPANLRHTHLDPLGLHPKRDDKEAGPRLQSRLRTGKV